ncbi:hypothetical protein, conserved [Plasmodium gonderi]|uniref:Osmiophilic body protein n=1 Tax=Plasmodium gonderi TaxID=77519 RepID=A0A1Y1JQS3_PLAGO|nr:hypothetical protein, conserved [Plasmodium gonderi]GAW83865.1 hypothetical protein, conserved [Plasmodium gonderi]
MVRLWICLVVVYLVIGVVRCRKDLNFDQIIKYLKETKVIPEEIPDTLEETINIVPPYLIYKYKGKIYYLHNNVDITPVEERKYEPVFPLQDIDAVSEVPVECHPITSGGEVENVVVPTQQDEPKGSEPDSIKLIVDEETGMLFPTNTKEIIETVTEINNTFELPKDAQWNTEENEKNNTMYLFGKENSTMYKIKEIFHYKENKDMHKNIQIGYERFYNESPTGDKELEADKMNPQISYNIEMKDYSSFLTSLHILLKNDEELGAKKIYKINNVPKTDIYLFVKQAYKSIHDTLKNYILLSGFSFYDYTYDVGSFSLDTIMNDFFFLSNNSHNEKGTFRNITSSIKYISTAKDKLSVYKIEKAIKKFLIENNLRVLDLKLIHHLFSRNYILNCTENDIINFATDLVNITDVEISPRVAATIFSYLLQKINIHLMPNYPTKSKDSYLLYKENNDLLIISESIYRNIFKNFYRIITPYGDLPNTHNHEKVLAITPWVEKIYPHFKSTYDFLSMKYGFVLFYNIYHTTVKFFEGNSDLRQIMQEHKSTNKVDTLDKFLNQLVGLFKIGTNSSSSVFPASLFSMVQVEEKPRGRILTSDNVGSESGAHLDDKADAELDSEVDANLDTDLDDDDEEDEKEHEKEEAEAEEIPDEKHEEVHARELSKYNELRNAVQSEMIEERKKIAEEREEEYARIKKQEEDEIAEIDRKHELETQQLEEEEKIREPLEDAKFEKEHAAGLLDEQAFRAEQEAARKEKGIEKVIIHETRETPESFYYNTALNYIYKRMEDVYKKALDSGFRGVAEIDNNLKPIYRVFRRKGDPDYGKLKDQVIKTNEKLFDELNTRIKNEESKRSNIYTYKSEIDAQLDKMMEKSKDGKYIITSKLINDNLQSYKDKVLEQCQQKFYGKFRKSLGNKKMQFLKQLNVTLKYAIRIVTDLAPSYDEAETTKKFTDIYKQKKELYKKEYSKIRRIISRNMDVTFRNKIKSHFNERDEIVRKELQTIREYILGKIDQVAHDMYNDMHVEIEIDMTSIKQEKIKIKKKSFQLAKEAINFPNDLKVLEERLLQLETDNSPDGIKKKETLTNEIEKLKQKIETNKKEAQTFREHMDALDQRYEQTIIKLDSINEIEKKLRTFKYEIDKEYKDCKMFTDALVPESDKDAGEYRQIEKLTKDLLFSLDDIKREIYEANILLHILKNKKKHTELDIQIRSKLHKVEENAENTSKNDLKKQQLKEIVSEIENQENELERLYIKRDLEMNDLNYITSDSENEPPETIKYFLPELVKKKEKKNLEHFMIEIMIETEIENNALTKLTETFNNEVLFYKYPTINTYDYLKLPYDEKNMHEKMSAEAQRNANIYASKLEDFRTDLKKYERLIQKHGGQTQPDAINYLKRNIIHLRNMIYALRKNEHVRNLTYILTNPDFFQNGSIKNEDRQCELAHTSLLKKYLKLHEFGNSLTEARKKANLFEVHYKYTSDKVLWYWAILKKYIERSEMVYNNSYDSTKRSRLKLTEFSENDVSSISDGGTVLLQYGQHVWRDSWGEAVEKRKYLRVIKKEQTFPYKLKEVKDLYVLNKILKDKLIRSGKLQSLKDYMYVKVYNIVEQKEPNMVLFEKEELKQLDLLSPDGNIIQGSVKNYLSHLPTMQHGVEEYLKDILKTASDYLTQSDMTYDSILEVIKYLQSNPNSVNIRDIITLSEKILDNSRVFYLSQDTLSIYILTFLELLGVQVKMDDIQAVDKKSRVLTYLNVLKSYYERINIKDEIKNHVLGFLKPKQELQILQYNPKLHEFLLGILESLDGNNSLYENFKKENPEFSTLLLNGIKKGIDEFIDYFFSKLNVPMTDKFKSRYYSVNEFTKIEKEKLLVSSYNFQIRKLNDTLTLFSYYVNPSSRNLLNEHYIKANISCIQKFPTFDFKDIFSVVDGTMLKNKFEEKMGDYIHDRIHSLVNLWRLFLHSENKEFFTYEKVSSAVESYFSDNIFDKNTKSMLSKLAYSFLARISYHTVSYFDIEMEPLIQNSDIQLISLFHNILNKINYILYCDNEKLYLERYTPSNLLSYNRPFKLDALKIFHEFITSLPHYLRSHIVNFFETDFSEITSNLIVDLFHHFETFLDNNSNSFEKEEENKIESFFKLNISFTKNRNVLNDDYQSMLQESPDFKETKMIHNRRVIYDPVNKKTMFKQYLDLHDIIDEKSFKILLQTLIKEHITFDQLNEKFKNFMKKKKITFPKFDILKKKIIETADELYYLKIYKYLYDLFQKIHISQPIHDLYFLFVKQLLDYSIAPHIISDDHVQKQLNIQLGRKYQKYINFLNQLFSCLFNYYYFDEMQHCEAFGNYISEQEFPTEQKILNVIQTPFIQMPDVVQNNEINFDYHMNEEDLFLDFIKEFIPDSEKMEKKQLKVESFKIRYFITEISKFVMRTVMSKMPSSYIFNMGYKDFYINIDDIINNLRPFFEKAQKKSKEQSDHHDPIHASSSSTAATDAVRGTITNFMDIDNVESANYRYKNIKFYLNSYITQLFLQNNMSFKYFMHFIKNIDKFKRYFPTLSELYIFVDKQVNIINAITNPNFTKRASTQTIIQIFVDTLKNFNVDLYEF